MPPEKAVRRVGAYAKLLANYYVDDAIMAAGEEAELLFVRGLAFCATSDSDGYITEAQVHRFVGAGMKRVPQRIEALVREGIWERADGGYVVRSWTRIHETAEEKARHRKNDRERKRRQAGLPKDSARNPAGLTLDSLSLIHDTTATRQRNDMALHLEDSEGGERYLTTEAPDVTTPPKTRSRCTKHPDGNATNENCHGCRADREWDEAEEARAAAALIAARLNCQRCDVNGQILDPVTNLPIERCDHLRSVS